MRFYYIRKDFFGKDTTYYFIELYATDGKSRSFLKKQFVNKETFDNFNFDQFEELTDICDLVITENGYNIKFNI